MGSLRYLSVDQQVGLLFVGLFGLLSLISFAVFSRSLVEGTDEQLRLLKRYRHDVRALWVGAFFFWVAWISGTVGATLLFGVISFLTFREFISLTHTRRADHRTLILAFFVVLPLQFMLVALRKFDLFSVFIPVYVFLALPIVSALGNDPQRFLERTAKIQWGTMVCIFGTSHAPALLLLDLPKYQDRGAFLVFYLVVVVAGAQFFQATATRYLRRRPVARAISRSFSWRAWWVGVFSGAILGALMYWATPFKPIPALVMGLIVAASGTLGELVLRALKRDAGVKAMGNKGSVTGAVGLMDRVAPLCFAAPVFFHSVRWYFGV